VKHIPYFRKPFFECSSAPLVSGTISFLEHLYTPTPNLLIFDLGDLTPHLTLDSDTLLASVCRTGSARTRIKCDKNEVSGKPALFRFPLSRLPLFRPPQGVDCRLASPFVAAAGCCIVVWLLLPPWWWMPDDYLKMPVSHHPQSTTHCPSLGTQR